MKHGSTQTISAEEMFKSLKLEIADLVKQLELQTYFKKSTEMEIERVCKQITRLSKDNQAFNVKKMALEEMLRE